MPRQKFDIAYLIANHHLAFTKMKPQSEMEVTHVVDLGHTAYVYMHSQRDSSSVRRKGNLHMIYSAFHPYRILHMCVCITEHDYLPLYIMCMHQIPAAWIRMPTVCHIMDPYINYLTCGSPLLSISSATHACSTRFMQHGLGLLAHMVLATIPSLH